MSLLIIIMTIHFVAGAFGILFVNTGLSPAEKKQHWLKFLVYLLIYIIVSGSVIINKNIFLGFCITIFSISLFEILKINQNSVADAKGRSFFIKSLIIFSIVIILFSLFILLPREIIVYTYSIVIIFDGASQISGQLAGRRKILPVLSPGKTLEGLLGGTASAVITSVILHSYAGISVLFAFFSGIVICLASFLGDLGASTIKRAYNKKDFGNILPGQGGMLDRFDSFLVAGAITGLFGMAAYLRYDQIDRNIAVYLGYSLWYAVFLIFGEFLSLFFKARAEYSRILSHFFAGIASLFIIILFTSQWYIISLCLQSAIFMWLSKKMGVFGSHHEVSRKTFGSSFFFAGLLLVYLIAEYYGDISLFILPILILTVSDPIASLTGLNSKSGYLPGWLSVSGSGKTWIGSLGFFISSFIILFVGIHFFYPLPTQQILFFSLLISIITTITEGYSSGGTDNVTVPLISSVTLAILSGF